MVSITSTNETDFALVKEALQLHGFKIVSRIEKKYRWFGDPIYTIKVIFSPGVPFLKILLEETLRKEDYWSARVIQTMIDIKSNE